MEKRMRRNGEGEALELLWPHLLVIELERVSGAGYERNWSCPIFLLISLTTIYRCASL